MRPPPSVLRGRSAVPRRSGASGRRNCCCGPCVRSSRCGRTLGGRCSWRCTPTRCGTSRGRRRSPSRCATSRTSTSSTTTGTYPPPPRPSRLPLPPLVPLLATRYTHCSLLTTHHSPLTTHHGRCEFAILSQGRTAAFRAADASAMAAWVQVLRSKEGPPSPGAGSPTGSDTGSPVWRAAP